MSVHFLSKKYDWATPWPLFRELDARFGPFELDVCATAHNAKCKKFFSPEDDGLNQVWYGVCWMNPPYGRALPHWMAKAVNEIEMERAKRVICLLPARQIRHGGTGMSCPLRRKSIICAGVSALKGRNIPRLFRVQLFFLKNSLTAQELYPG